MGGAAGGGGAVEGRREQAAGAVAGAAGGLLLGFLLGERGLWIVALSAGVLVAGLIVLAVAGERRRRRATGVAAVLGLLVAGSLAALLALAGRAGSAAWPLGVPLALWVLFGGLWLVPLVLTGLGHAWSFDAAPGAAEPDAGPAGGEGGGEARDAGGAAGDDAGRVPPAASRDGTRGGGGAR